ncbi:MFS transporter [Paenibacillus sp. OAS669]|uniref:MFS transporter n=1 Tax=Paenibacillus sp. OAS669 TaxID=2663821 RepID=UPI00178BEDD3|nr:MFS transporter [Paenibacillus sp. OAS669]MBE1443039.1 FSR family fosmidomycin resistance protein-like MFS transporter [Paenibacillus sp. OAS669]
MNQQAVLRQPSTTIFSVLFAISFVHFLNDAIQSVIPAMFPILRDSLNLSFAQIGWIGFTLNMTASVIQPVIGLYTDSRPKPYLLPIGMIFSLTGVIGLAYAPSFIMLLLFVILIGIGSAVLHPESSRVAHLAGGNRKGLAQSIFQVGGNTGQALAPVMAALIFIPLGQQSILWFTLAAGAAIIIQLYVSRWYGTHLQNNSRVNAAVYPNERGAMLSKGTVAVALAVLVSLLFSKFVYMASMTGYYAFFLMERFHMTVQDAQYYLFALLIAGMLGTLAGGPFADRFGRRNTIWFSILGTAPFSILLPFAGPVWSMVLCICIGLILLSGFSVIVVYAQELLPGKVGTIAGLFFGLAFGLGGIGSALLGYLADSAGLDIVIKVSAFLPLLGLLAILLPSDAKLSGR